MKPQPVALAVALLLAGCATHGPWQPAAVSMDRTYSAPYEVVWPALKDVMSAYPVHRVDNAAGVVETEWMYVGTTMGVDEVGPAPGPQDIYRMVVSARAQGDLTLVSIRTYQASYRRDSAFGSPDGGPSPDGYTYGYTIYTSDTDEEQRILGRIGDKVSAGGQ